jgi:cell division protein FtsI (penicillin-binding protein 3)
MTALEDGYIQSLDDRIPTNNGRLPGYPQDDHVIGMTDISILHGFEISSNYVFRYLAVKNYADDPKRFLDKLYLYKLGQAFDFDLEGLKEPFIPSPEGSLWSQTSLGSIGMGYSIQETPLHILTFYNAIANKGRMMKPYLVERIEKNGKTVEKRGPSVLNASICSKATADTMLRAMKAVTTEGTAKRLKGAKVEVAGKTGTSRQILTGEEIKKYGMANPYVTLDGSYKNLGTFVGFFPADNPKYSAIICVRSTLIRGSLYGGVLPAAAMRQIVDQLYALDPTWGEEITKKGSVPKAAVAAEYGAMSTASTSLPCICPLRPTISSSSSPGRTKLTTTDAAASATPASATSQSQCAWKKFPFFRLISRPPCRNRRRQPASTGTS